MIKNDDGLTLIELIVSITIITIVLGAILSFMITGSNSYKKEKEAVNLQTEAQFILNQLDDLLIEANYVKFNQVDKKLIIYQSGITYEITYEIDKLYFRKQTLTDVGTKSILGEYVSDFYVDTSNLTTDNTILVKLSLEQGKSTYAMSSKVVLRNEVINPED
ncbi:MAG: prepilin-type N-terminal cleavage/methylation domain [Anaerocolumna sp.]|nr:prepilin-type N-terminal cleavage/methylation domain [Anaerocolumna sp.]